MEHQLPELPYARDALVPHISKETLDYHYGQHHATYVEKLRGLIADTAYAGLESHALLELHGAECRRRAGGRDSRGHRQRLSQRAGEVPRGAWSLVNRDFVNDDFTA